MIITISGVAGSGKSTISKLLAQKLGYKHYSTGDFMRSIAKERNMTLLELSKLAENDRSIDLELDKRQKELGKKEDDFVIDARLGWYFIPHSFKIFLDVDINAAAKRIFKDQRVHESYKDIKESIEKIKARINSEEKRYKEYYNIDYRDKSHYDLVINTTKTVADEVAELISKKVKKI